MPDDSWICLAVSNGPGMLSEGLRSTLKRFACMMHRARTDRMLISSDYCAGVMETTWDSQLIGTKGGILFKARLDDEQGDFHQVNFLYSMDDLERGALDLERLDSEGVWQTIVGERPHPILTDFGAHDPYKRLY